MSASDEDLIYGAIGSRTAVFSIQEIRAQLVEIGDFDASLVSLTNSGRAVQLDPDSVVSDVAANRLESTARRVVGAFHKKQPFLLGMQSGDLDLFLPKAATYPNLAVIVEWLVGRSVLVTEARNRVRLPEHTIVMPEGWRAAAQEMLTVYEAAALTPPSSYNFQANYPRHINVRAILAILAETGALVRVEDEIYISSAAYDRVKKTVRNIAAHSGGSISVGAVRDALGSTRKFVLPLLELLNAESVTRREGDLHYLA